MDNKICSKCDIEKNISNFRFRKDRNTYRNECNDCLSIKDKKYYLLNKNTIIKRNSNYYENNKEYLSLKKKEYYEKNKDYWINYLKCYLEKNNNILKEKKKEYYKNNKNILNKKKLAWRIARRKNNQNFALRTDISSSISAELKNNNSSKLGKSCLDYLPYTIQELKTHLEKQFASWMNWNNRGKYNSKTWNDSDSSTWVWQIDHIIPHSTFKYISMGDEEFKKCWSLDNLRPYSAKQNVLDGVRK